MSSPIRHGESKPCNMVVVWTVDLYIDSLTIMVVV